MYRVLLIAAYLTQEVFSGGQAADHVIWLRYKDGLEKTHDAKQECGMDITPDFIEGCYYTDCFTSTTTSRRRLGDAPINKKPNCNVKPMLKQPGETQANADARINAGNALADSKICSAGDSKARLKVTGGLGGDHVCHYANPMPSGAIFGTGPSNSCFCRTMVCQVITYEDKTYKRATGTSWTGKQTTGALKYTTCNMVVRIEDSHNVDYVPKWAMWAIFGVALGAAMLVSIVFIAMYNDESAHHHGHGHGHGEHGHGHDGGEAEKTKDAHEEHAPHGHNG